MADMRYFLLGAFIMVMTWLAPVHSKYTKGGDGCSTYTAAVEQCIVAVSQRLPILDLNLLCQVYNETEACMDAAATAAAATCSTPPEESKEWTDKWVSLENTAKPLCAYPPGDTSCENFEAQAVDCQLTMANEAGEDPDLAELCRLFGELRTCMDPLVARCPDEAQDSANWKSMQQQWQNIC